MRNPILTNPMFSVELICGSELPAARARLLSINLQRVLRKTVHAWIAEQRLPGLDFRISSGEHIGHDPTVLEVAKMFARDPNVHPDFAKALRGK